MHADFRKLDDKHLIYFVYLAIIIFVVTSRGATPPQTLIYSDCLSFAYFGKKGKDCEFKKWS